MNGSNSIPCLISVFSFRKLPAPWGDVYPQVGKISVKVFISRDLHRGGAFIYTYKLGGEEKREGEGEGVVTEGEEGLEEGGSGGGERGEFDSNDARDWSAAPGWRRRT